MLVNATGVYLEPDQFISDVFNQDVPKVSRIWLKRDLRNKVEDILEDAFPTFRVRYWGREMRTAWILETIGKYEPITVGIVVNQHKIETIKILIFRETRGYEVRHPFFTRQFDDAILNGADKLDRHIDGISGATLSVNAVSRLARIALLLHQHSDFTE